MLAIMSRAISRSAARQAHNAVEVLRRDKRAWKLITADGTLVELPRLARQTLLDTLEVLARGDEPSVLASAEELSSQQVANALGVSRPYLVKLLEAGLLPFRRVGRHRRVRAADLADLIDRLEVERVARRRSLEQLTREIRGLVSKLGR